MLEASKKEGDEEKEIFAKFKCYCDTNEKEKNDNIKEMTAVISTLESKIEELQGSTGTLSSECAELKTNLAENKMAQDTATKLRKKENGEYKDFMSDAAEAVSDMSDAIKTLAAVGADQTKSTGADNKQFMAGFGGGFLQVNSAQQAAVKKAINIASAYMNIKQQEQASAFLQAPFTGTYTSQSAQIMGILKNMRDTFKKNMEEAELTEKKAKDAYDSLMKTLKEEEDTMNKSYDTKQGELGDNDDDLADKKKSLAESKKSKANDEDFLSQLIPMCEKKTKHYEERKVLRANEEAAIAEAISILNSDAAFATFQDTDAGTTGFLQLRAVRRHMTRAMTGKSQAVMQVLSEAASKANSARLRKVALMVKADNPFEEVLKEIDNMLDLIVKESEADTENRDWCVEERKVKRKLVKDTDDAIDVLTKTIDTLDKAINNPRDGLLKLIDDEEIALEDNIAAQTTETKERTEDNLAYQKDIKTLVSAEGILKKAIKVLTTYYESMDKQVADGVGGFIQTRKEDPAPPPDSTGSYDGQSAGGNKAIDMLEFILKETIQEEMDAHSAEEDAQHDYEDSMTKAKALQEKQESTIVTLKETLAEKEQELADAEKEKKAEEEILADTKAYLKKIKPGCDFIEDNYDLREKNRGIESAALKKAIGLIKGTPAFKNFKADERSEGFGKCQSKCEDKADEPGAVCQACLADVTVPAYCAGHKGTPGC